MLEDCTGSSVSVWVPGCSHHSSHLGLYYISHGGADERVRRLIKSCLRGWNCSVVILVAKTFYWETQGLQSHAEHPIRFNERDPFTFELATASQLAESEFRKDIYNIYYNITAYFTSHCK